MLQNTGFSLNNIIRRLLQLWGHSLDPVLVSSLRADHRSRPHHSELPVGGEMCQSILGGNVPTCNVEFISGESGTVAGDLLQSSEFNLN